MTEDERLYFVELKRKSLKRSFDNLQKSAREGTLKQVSPALTNEQIERISIGKTEFKE